MICQPDGRRSDGQLLELSILTEPEREELEVIKWTRFRSANPYSPLPKALWGAAILRSWDKQKDRLQIPLMFAFRDAFERRDSAKPGTVEIDGERVVSDRGSIRRRGADETTLKRDLAQDLASLVDTVNLASAVDLADYPYVERSVLNYGLNDLTQVAVGSEEVNKVGTDLKQALADHEPRLGSESLNVRRADEAGDGLKARVRFKVQADMACRPLDVPIEFVAEVDMTAAKVVLPKLPGSS